MNVKELPNTPGDPTVVHDDVEYPLRGAQPLIEELRPYLGRRAIWRIELRYNQAFDCHAGQRRKNGYDYMAHPLAVAWIGVHEFKLRSMVLAIILLLHDSLEDSRLFHPWSDRDYARKQLPRLLGRRLARALLLLSEGPDQTISEYYQDFHVWDRRRFLWRLWWPSPRRWRCTRP